jgi:hypothetical protein
VKQVVSATVHPVSGASTRSAVSPDPEPSALPDGHPCTAAVPEPGFRAASIVAPGAAACHDFYFPDLNGRGTRGQLQTKLDYLPAKNLL